MRDRRHRGLRGSAQQQTVVGETPNLAARLQGIVEPNTVIIAETTRKMLGNLFEMQDLGAQDLKGIGGRVRAWGRIAAVFGRKPLRGAAWGWTDRPRREGGRARIALTPLVASKEWRRPMVLLSGEAAWPVRPRRAFGGSCPTRALEDDHLRGCSASAWHESIGID